MHRTKITKIMYSEILQFNMLIELKECLENIIILAYRYRLILDDNVNLSHKNVRLPKVTTQCH